MDLYGQEPVPPGTNKIKEIAELNLKFDKRQEELNYKGLSKYMAIPVECEGTRPLLHVKGGVFMTTNSEHRVEFYVPGKSHQASGNFVAMLQEDLEVTGALVVFNGTTNKKAKSATKEPPSNDLQILYSCGVHLKMLSVRTLNSMVVYKNLRDITAIALVHQSPSIVSLGTASGVIKDYDMNSKAIVRNESKRHKNKILAIDSFEKYVVSVSQELCLIYHYAKQEDFAQIKSQEVGAGNFVSCLGIKDNFSQHEFVLIATKTDVLIYVLNSGQFAHEISAQGKLNLPKTAGTIQKLQRLD